VARLADKGMFLVLIPNDSSIYRSVRLFDGKQAVERKCILIDFVSLQILRPLA